MISFMQLVFRDWDEDEVSHTCLVVRKVYMKIENGKTTNVCYGFFL